MKIRMREVMSGGRHDGRPWPPPGVDFEVPDWEGRDLIAGQLAVPADRASRKVAEGLGEQPAPGHPSKLDQRPAEAEPPGEPPAAPGAAENRAGETGSDGLDAGAAEPAAGHPAAGPVTAEAPAPSAVKQDWIDWAIAQGADPELAAAMTKADLMSRYGGRL